MIHICICDLLGVNEHGKMKTKIINYSKIITTLTKTKRG